MTDTLTRELKRLCVPPFGCGRPWHDLWTAYGERCPRCGSDYKTPVSVILRRHEDRVRRAMAGLDPDVVRRARALADAQEQAVRRARERAAHP